ncbi:hypothetical protein PVAND_017321 [Polypedilum vanderplanki]|uniref:Leucine rich repeat protein n=1 Tax=Polypedilum vanderplanki TaxID=319348 RepID=A0A9J6BI98_POLVA|nr:hypothetical protein PVAND_017321 [Polypedilum vanderplanki]
MKFLKFASIIFIPLTFAINLDCIFDYQRLDFVGEIYICNVTNNFTITAPETFITSVNGTHLLGFDNSDVHGFYSKNHIVNFMPYGLTKFFPNLAEIFILNAEMKEIHQKDFQQYPNLNGLNFTNNNITRIEKDLFKFNPVMNSLSLRKNPIKEIHPNVFDQFYHVFDISFLLEIKYNNCTEKYKFISKDVIQNEILNCKPQLHFELFDGKKIDLEEIDENIEKFKREMNEKNLDIEDLKNEMFKSQIKSADMNFFSIKKNPIKEIHPKVFDQFHDVFDRPFWFEINYDNCTGDDKYIHYIEDEIQKNILKCKPQHYFELSDDKKIDLEEIDENIEKYKIEINKINLDIEDLKNEMFKNQIKSAGFSIFLFFISLLIINVAFYDDFKIKFKRSNLNEIIMENNENKN